MNTPFDDNKTHSHTQSLWRFLGNEKIEISDLSQPLLENAKQGIISYCDEYVLIAHDWSRIALKHKNKEDTKTMSHKHDVGYELQSSIAISDVTGKAIAPIAQNMISSDKRLSTYTDDLDEDSHLNELTKRMTWIDQQELTKKPLHIIDREADSAFHMRAWAENGHDFLLRAKGSNRLEYQGTSQKTKDIADALAYEEFKEINYQGKPAILKVAQAEVLLTRHAKPLSFDDNGKRVKPVKGNPLTLNLVCTRVENKKGELIAQWFLLSNNQQLSHNQLAQYYYYRWEIESYFKLLKSSGHQMEDWLQQNVEAFFKRALIVAQSCIMVWQLMNDTSKNSIELRQLLVRLSGRQMKRNVEFTAPALFDGYLKLLSAYELLQYFSPDEIALYVKQFQGELVV